MTHILYYCWCFTFREACSDTGRSRWSSFKSLHDNDIPPRAFTYWIGSYWAVSAMLADSRLIAPSNSGEALFSEVAMLVGVCFVGFVLAALVSQVGDLQAGDRVVKSRQPLLRGFSDACTALWNDENQWEGLA